MKVKSLYTAITIMVVVTFVMYFIVPLPKRAFILWDDVIEAVAFALAAIFLLKASNYAIGLEQKSLKLFASGFGFWIIGEGIWTIFDILHPKGEKIPFPYFSDIGFFAFYILVLIGLLVLLKHYSPFMSTKQWIFAFVAFIILIGIGLPLVILPSMRSTELTFLGKALSFIYPFSDIVIITLTIPVISLTAGGKIGQSWLIIVIGFALITAADVIFSYLALTGASTVINDSNFGFLWTLGGLVVMAGAVKYMETHS